MTIKDSYSLISGNYEGVLNRLGSEDRIARFVHKFFETGDFEKLEEGVKNRDASKVFDFSHKMKGNALNMGFESFAKDMSNLVEYVRPRTIPDENELDKMFFSLKMQYNSLIKAFEVV